MTIGQTPATVSVIEREQMERENMTRPQDLTRYEPGVSFSNQPSRTGGGNFIIRGIGGNRVLVLTDGIRVPDFPGSNIGAGTFTRDFVDLENVQRVEIVRGPASALYGSDAIGGVVAYVTRDPGDYLAPGQNTYGSIRMGYSGVDRSFYEALTGAVRAGPIDMLGIITQRNGQNVVPNYPITPNPQSYSSTSFLGRLVWNISDADRIRITGEVFRRDVSTNLLTELSPSVITSDGNDRTMRGLGSIEYNRTQPLWFIDSMTLRGYWTGIDRREQTDQYRRTAPVPAGWIANRYRATELTFNQQQLGADAIFRSSFNTWGAEHLLTYGASFINTETERPRDRFEINLATGAFISPISGERFPNKNFPDTTTQQTGVYVQDEIRYGALTLFPGVRFDWYNLTPHPDADFYRSAVSAAAGAVRPISDSAVSPKFGLTYRLNETFSLYGQYAAGFRAPPYDNANFGFTNPVFGYTILPNFNLQPETVNSFEAGLRGRTPAGSFFQVSAYYNSYRNFIDTRVIGVAQGLQVFQYQNLSNVTIYGAEARGELRINENWRARASAAWAYGYDNQTNLPIDSVDAFRATGGVRWDSGWGLGAEANLTGGLRHNRVSNPTYYQTPAYMVLDLAANYDLGRQASINFGLFNVTNTRYFLSADMSGVTEANPNRGLYAQPGRYAAVNMVLRF